MKALFKKLKVIELASVLAGPSVGMFFAELGAKVTKIENPANGGDVTRSWKLPNETNKISAYYASVNVGKKIVWLNLTIKNDREKLYKLVSKADIVITNYKSGDDKKLGVDYPTLSGINKQIIYASISGFSSNPDKTAFDVVLQAETGFMSMTGNAGEKPVKMPVALIDILAAHQLKEAILMALIKRAKNGKGSKINVSLEQAAIASLANQATNYLMENHIATPMGSAHPNIAPYGDLFETADNKLLVLAVGTNKQFVSLCELLNLENLPLNPNFSNNTARVENRTLLVEHLQQKIALINAGQLITSLKLHKIPYGVVRNIKEVLSLPIAKEMLINDIIEGQPVKTLSTLAFKFEKT